MVSGTAPSMRGAGLGSRGWIIAAITAVGYYVLSLVGNLMLPEDGIAVLWPASGFAAVMLLWSPGVLGKVVTLVAVAVGYAAFAVGATAQGAAEAGFVLANVVEPALALPFLLRATARDNRLSSLGSLGWLASGAVVACAASASVAAAAILVSGDAAGTAATWRDWFVGDCLGILVVAPLLLQARPLSRLWRRGSAAEQVLLWLVLATSLLLLIEGSALAVVVLGAVVLIAVRLDPAATSLAILGSSVVMAVLAMSSDLLVDVAGGPGWADVRVLIAVVVVVGQAVALSTAARVRALGERDEAVAAALASARRAQDSDTSLREALDAGLDAFVVLRRDGSRWRVAFANGPARSASGIGPDAVVDAPLADLLPAEAHPMVDALLLHAADSDAPVRVAAPVVSSSTNWAGTVEIVASRTADGRIVVTWRDVTQDHAQERKVRAASAAAMHAATHDSLTNLPNRMLLEDRFRHAVAGLGRSEDAVAVVVADIDGFRTIRERHGEPTADAVLIEVASRIESLVRSQDTVARVGSDEFELVLTGLTRSWSAPDFFDRMAAEVGAPIDTPAGPVQVTVSAAHLLVTDPMTTPDVVRNRLFAALKHGRETGPGQITEYSDELRLPQVWAPAASDIATALSEGEFRLAYQPVIELRTGDVVGQEALIRWTHPEHGAIGPDQFIGVAESAGLMVDIGDWVLRQALADRRRQPAGTWTSINVSSAQLVRRDLVADVEAALTANGVEAGSLVLELVESQLLHATPTTLGRLEALRARGVRIALDDFGSGYSSLSYLQDFSVDIVKLDRGLIDGPSDDRRLRFLRWLADLAPTTGVTIIVEGIETHEQRDLTLAAGLRFGQGYLWGRPAFLV